MTSPYMKPDAMPWRPKSRAWVGALFTAAIVAAVLGVIGWNWLQQRKPELTPPEPQAANPAPAPAPAASAPVIVAAAEPASAPAMSASAVAAQTATAEPPVQATDAGAAVAALFSRNPQAALLQTSDFARRLVATVDNLGRRHAPVLMWPVTPTAGRFSVETRGEQTVIAADNAARYARFVALAESVDVARTTRLYRRLYPVLQDTYTELGYPQRHFHSRLIEVIEQLLATPERAGPVSVRLTEVKGSVPSTQPWTRYEFEDPALEALSAGQKMLIRMGPENRQRLKAKLGELRAALTTIDALR